MKYEKIINLTQHDLKEMVSGLVIPSSATGVARVECKKEIIYEDETGFIISKTIYGNIVGLDINNINPNALYIVSAQILNALQDRNIYLENVVAPANSIRDRHGNVIGTEGFRING